MHTPASHGKTPEQMIEAIFALDLEPIRFKLMSRKEGQGWTREEAERHELGYRRFLALLVKYPDQVIAPDTEVDKFWHGHILDTMKYARDCEQVFGAFLHHYPYFGMRGDEDAAQLDAAFRRMQELSAREFGGDGTPQPAWCAAAAGGGKDAAWCAAPLGRPLAAEGKDAAWCAAAAGIPQGGSSPAWCAASLQDAPPRAA